MVTLAPLDFWEVLKGLLETRSSTEKQISKKRTKHSAYILLLEVMPAYRQRGIGSELVRKLLPRLNGLYMIDLLCDPSLQPFYASLGLQPATGAMMRDYAHQRGRS